MKQSAKPGLLVGWGKRDIQGTTFKEAFIHRDQSCILTSLRVNSSLILGDWAPHLPHSSPGHVENSLVFQSPKWSRLEEFIYQCAVLTIVCHFLLTILTPIVKPPKSLRPHKTTMFAFVYHNATTPQINGNLMAFIHYK